MNFRNLFKPRTDSAEISVDVVKATTEELEAELRRLGEIQDACRQRRRVLADLIEARKRKGA